MDSSSSEQSSFIYRPPINFLIYSALLPLTLFVWYTPWWPLVGVCWVATAHFGHTIVLALHEGAHYHLHPVRWMNELRGVSIGVGTLTPFTVYRELHQYHHSALSTIKDKELWPYNDPHAPRWLRIAAAWGELLLGIVVTPAIYVYGFCHLDVAPEVRRRAYGELLLMAATWSGILAVIHHFDWWIPFVVAWLVPAVLTGSLQAARKFTEHLGLLANGPLSASRTILHAKPLGWLMSRTMLNIGHHGTHHRYGKLPYYEIPAATPKAYGPDYDQGPVFSSYWSAFCDMLPALLNPRVGAQWCNKPAVSSDASDPELVSAQPG